MNFETRPFLNGLLAALPADELDWLRPNFHPVTFVMGQIVHEVGSPIDDVFFPESGIVSLTADTGDAGAVEVGLTGREGFVGTSVALNGRASSIHRAIVQVPGTGHRILAPVFRDALEARPAFRDRCLRHVHFLMVQTAQSAACNARHGLTARLADGS